MSLYIKLASYQKNRVSTLHLIKTFRLGVFIVNDLLLKIIKVQLNVSAKFFSVMVNKVPQITLRLIHVILESFLYCYMSSTFHKNKA